MDDNRFERLAGSIEAVSKAVLHLTAALEMQGVIDGPQVSQLWQQALPPGTEGTPQVRETRMVLQRMIEQLNEARQSRQLRTDS